MSNSSILSGIFRDIYEIYRRSEFLVVNHAIFVSNLPCILLMSLSICVHESSHFVQWTVLASAFDNGTSFSFVVIASVDLVPSAVSKCLRTANALFQKLVTSVRNKTFSRTSYIPHARSILLVCFLVCVQSMIIRYCKDVTKFTVYSVLASVVNGFASQILACSYAARLDAFCDSTLDILDMSHSLPEIEISAECINKTFLALWTVPLIQQSMYVGPNEMSTTKLSAMSNHKRTCRVCISKMNRTAPLYLDRLLIAARSLGASRRLMQLSQVGLG